MWSPISRNPAVNDFPEIDIMHRGNLGVAKRGIFNNSMGTLNERLLSVISWDKNPIPLNFFPSKILVSIRKQTNQSKVRKKLLQGTVEFNDRISIVKSQNL
jgi:hypothetical protein